ncbi:alpha/beta-hydrolase [Polyplosphaeria fusca]|uniref:Carboxypeptidase n=1 Tax=Polyplosphaeria fusca TaxID=682080 RepID=A0A9P4QWX4_9PLEO|nr:alpha/beta-hydrolase [Polyplosphaeria fusca]
MKLSTGILGALFCASTVVGALRRDIRRPKPIFEKRAAGHEFQSRELRKRADKFLTDKTKEFSVDGANFPKIPFDIGESYAGLLPISEDEDETRKLFFWFFPSTLSETPKDIVIWLNGGPGCSSLSGLLTENGPFTWEAGTLAPVQNPYSWTNLTNMIWVEQPVGVGYSQGVPNITNEVELGLEFRGFWKNFIDTFDLQQYDMYITGESYAGFYVPYIADSFIQADDTDYFNLKGISINDPIIADDTTQQQVNLLPYVEYWQNVLYLNDTFMDQMRERNAQCNYTYVYDTWFQFPPNLEAGPLPLLPDIYDSPDYECDMFDNFYAAALEVNPCFNIYHIFDTCPHTYSQLGIVNTGDYSPPGAEVFFNRSDVTAALHAVPGTNWLQCSDINVFGNGNDTGDGHDTSIGPAANGVLQRVIEHTNNTIIGSGDLDLLLATNGTLLALQNMTWNGQQGFQSYPSTPLYAPYHPEYNGGALAGAGLQGSWGSERGLTFYTAQLAGHELPGYTPGVAYRMLEILLGRVKDFSSTEHFTTQEGNFTGNGTIWRRGVMGAETLLS